MSRRLLWWVLAPASATLLVLVILTAILLRPSRIKAMAVETLTVQLNLETDIAEISVSFFPRPRITGQGLTLRLPNRSDLPPFIEIESFWMDAGVVSILRRHVDTIHMDGLRISVPPGNARDALPTTGGDANPMSDVIIDRLVTHDAVLLFVPRKPEDDPLTFRIHDLIVTEVGFERRIPFTARLTNPVPLGMVDASGTIGPWRKEDATRTPVGGEYTFKDADLSTINGIGGTLSSTGRFSGNLAQIGVTGQADVPNFSLDLGGNPMPLATTFDAVVNGTDGTTVLQRVDATMRKTPMRVSGAITNLPGPGRRHVQLDVHVEDGRVEDLIALAIVSPEPLITGDVALDARLTLPPGPTRVRQRLKLEGQFGLKGARFTEAQVQGKLQEFSRRAQGKDKDEPLARVLTGLKGRFVLASGSLTLPDLTFQVPGAGIALAGRYGLADGSLDFQGTLRMQTTVSRAIGGFKSIFIKPFDGLFKKDGAGALVPIRITGTREAPKFGVQFGKILKRG